MTTQDKRARTRNYFGAAILGTLAAGCGLEGAPPTAHEQSSSDKSNPAEVTDPTGKITIQIRYCGPSARRSHAEIHCELTDDRFVLVGGGAWARYSGQGALLVASEPHPDAPDRVWRAMSKDHMATDEHQVEAAVIGMRLEGVSRNTLRSHMLYHSVTNQPGRFNADAVAPEFYNVLGGGGAVLADFGAGDPGALLTATYPIGRTWRTEAKDHIQSSNAQVRSWVIALHNTNIPGFGWMAAQSVSGDLLHTAPTQVGHTGVGVSDDRWLVTGIGARTEWNGQGRMLFNITPSFKAMATLDKDHRREDSGRLQGYLVQVRPAN